MDCGLFHATIPLTATEPLLSQKWERSCLTSRLARVILVVGTSAVVYPAAGLSELARAAGAKLAIINTAETPLDFGADWVLRGTAGESCLNSCVSRLRLNLSNEAD